MKKNKGNMENVQRVSHEAEAQERKMDPNSATTPICTAQTFFKSGSRQQKKADLIAESLNQYPI